MKEKKKTKRVNAFVQKGMNTRISQKLSVVLLNVRKTNIEILLLNLAFVTTGSRLMISEIANQKNAQLINP